MENELRGTHRPVVTSYIAAGRRRLHYNFGSEVDMVESSSPTDRRIALNQPGDGRKKENSERRRNGKLGKLPKEKLKRLGSKKPVFSRKDSVKAFEFRVRNLPYDADNFEVTLDHEKQQIVVRTKNKKYFKRYGIFIRIDIPDLERWHKGYKLEQTKLDWSFKNNTLLVSYDKPDFVLQREATIREEFKKMNKKNPREGEVECTYQ